jgi:hypothetical protein
VATVCDAMDHILIDDVKLLVANTRAFLNSTSSDMSDDRWSSMDLTDKHLAVLRSLLSVDVSERLSILDRVIELMDRKAEDISVDEIYMPWMEYTAGHWSDWEAESYVETSSKFFMAMAMFGSFRIL